MSLSFAASRARMGRFIAFPRIKAECRARFLNIPQFQKAITVKHDMARRCRINEIVDAVAREFGLTAADIISKRRDGPTVMARHIAIAICRALTDEKTSAGLGRAFSLDHTTVIYAMRKMQPIMDGISDAVDFAPLPILANIARGAMESRKP